MVQFMATVFVVVFATTGFADETRLELIQSIQLEGAAGRLDHFAIDAEGGRLFVADLSNDRLEVLDLKTAKPIKRIAGQRKIQGIAFAQGLDRIYVGAGGGESNVFDGKSYELLHSLKLPDADNVRFDQASGLVYVGHAEHRLIAFDAKSFKLKATIDLPAQPEAFQLDPEHQRLYVNCVHPSSVVAVDLTNHKVVAKHAPPNVEGFYPMALDRAGRRIFIGCRRPPLVLALAATTGKELWRVEIPADVDDLFFDAKRRRLYASCGAGFLAILEEKPSGSFELVERMPTAKMARTCFFEPTSSRLYLGVPRQPGKPGPEVRVYLARP